MKKIIGMGNALTDVLTRITGEEQLQELRIPKGSVQLMSEDMLERTTKMLSGRKTIFATGGAAGNTIKALANLQHSTGFIGKVGDDLYGRFYQTTFSKLGVDTKFLSSELPSGVATTLITPDGMPSFYTYLGAASTLTAQDITPNLFKGYSFFYLEGYLIQDSEMLLKAIHTARESKLKIVLSLPSYNIVDLEKELFKEIIVNNTDILFANEKAAKSLTGQEGEALLKTLASLCDTVVLKLGEGGSVILSNGKQISIKAVPVSNVVDTTGAGDYYAAGFLYGYAQDIPLEKCGKAGAQLASEVIQLMGTTLQEHLWNQIKKDIDKIIH